MKNFQTQYKSQWSKSSKWYLDSVWVYGEYRGQLARKIRAFKYFSNYQALKKTVQKITPTTPSDVIYTYPPFSFWKKVFRGRNHARILAQMITTNPSKIFHIQKKNNTPRNALLSKKGRQKNSQKQLFQLSPNTDLKNKTVYIIDDVISTGSTLNALAKFLKKNGAIRVVWVVVARGEGFIAF